MKEETTLDITIESLLESIQTHQEMKDFIQLLLFIFVKHGTPKAADDAKEVYVYKLDEIPLIIGFDHKKIILDF